MTSSEAVVTVPSGPSAKDRNRNEQRQLCERLAQRRLTTWLIKQFATRTIRSNRTRAPHEAASNTRRHALAHNSKLPTVRHLHCRTRTRTRILPISSTASPVRHRQKGHVEHLSSRRAVSSVAHETAEHEPNADHSALFN